MWPVILAELMVFQKQQAPGHTGRLLCYFVIPIENTAVGTSQSSMKNSRFPGVADPNADVAHRKNIKIIPAMDDSTENPTDRHTEEYSFRAFVTRSENGWSVFRFTTAAFGPVQSAWGSVMR